MSNQWSNGLCGCFNNFGVCIVTYFVPCYTAGKNAESVGENCLMCGLIQFVPLLNIYFRATVRGKIREQKGVEGGLVGDLLIHLCLPCCGLIQEAQEMQAVGGQAIARQ